MTDLRKAVIDVLDSYAAINATETSECYSFALCSHEQSIEALRAALAKTSEPVLFFFSGKEGSFYASGLKQGEDILKLMNVDTEDWTATELPEPPSAMQSPRQVLMRTDALIAELEALLIPDNFTYQTLIHKSHIEKIIRKYRAKHKP